MSEISIRPNSNPNVNATHCHAYCMKTFENKNNRSTDYKRLKNNNFDINFSSSENECANTQLLSPIVGQRIGIESEFKLRWYHRQYISSLHILWLTFIQFTIVLYCSTALISNDAVPTLLKCVKVAAQCCTCHINVRNEFLYETCACWFLRINSNRMWCKFGWAGVHHFRFDLKMSFRKN